ncbi:Pribosyltran domain-containing protein [Meloidogyne graminicola]|uniref:Pribosyltran domain-containing protein n=1 Tax=Meloidogyne graminicola TaxID=189291 RepID=A0A8S9ZBV5_9BILA|nr:Pribosyltran domain-containing protein [Meloidogyne graminicola]
MFFSRAAIFKDRYDAGQKLAEALKNFKSKKDNVVVLALPRGGVPVAYEVAKALGAPLDLLMVRKIGAPGHEEYGIGAVVEGNPPQLVMNEEAVKYTRPPEGYVQAMMDKQLREIARQRKRYLGDHPSLPLDGKIAIVVDDGIATGGTARVAMKALKQKNVARALLATPLAPSDTLAELRAEGNEVLVLETPPNFSAVGLHYTKFDQTSDEEVINCLEKSREWLPRGKDFKN